MLAFSLLWFVNQLFKAFRQLFCECWLSVEGVCLWDPVSLAGIDQFAEEDLLKTHRFAASIRIIADLVAVATSVAFVAFS